MQSTESQYTLQKLGFRYTETPVLQDINLEIPQCSFIHLQGPSGSGKTSFLRLLGRFEKLSSGSMLFYGQEIDSIPPKDFRNQVGYLHQKPIMESGTIRSNLLLPFSYHKELSPIPDDALLSDFMKRLLLEEVPLDQQASELSVGQQQRVAFLRLLIADTDVLLLDEPFASLDDASAEALFAWLLELHRTGNKTIIISAHGSTIPRNNGVSILKVENKSAWFES
jgi:UDP-glucose/iron transport system ATP-binding protein